ncbi:hypothetical protein GCM10027405_05530 [Arthrobacter alkaliphilus]|uniref:hypothetical protein n=1 Tax=Arthrobacter alkaliphilus TaxID=369936 RepID=UPI001F1DABFB|nr:hypothetical protein [Arthrobacter alkaliphilus]
MSLEKHPDRTDRIGPVGVSGAGERSADDSPAVAVPVQKTRVSRRLWMIVAAALVGLLALGAVIVMASNGAPGNPRGQLAAVVTASVSNSPSSTESLASPTATSPATGTGVPGTVPTLDPFMSDKEKVAVLQIKSGLSVDELGRVFAGLITSWGMAAKRMSTPEYLNSAGFAANQQREYATQLAAKQTPFYAEALFGKDWQAKAAAHNDVKKFISNHEIIDANDIVRGVLTSGDPVEYNASESMDTIELSAGTTSEGQVRITTTIHENIKDSPRLSELGVPSADGKKLYYLASYHTEGGALVFDSVVVS